MKEQSQEPPDDPEVLYVRRQFKLLTYRLHQLPEDVRARLQGHLAQMLIEDFVKVETPRGALSFVTLGRAGAGRGMNLLTKQPATIAWIDRFRPDSVFWDVGANVGVFTLYAASRGDTRVLAFEPAGVNFFLLAANCEANRFEDRVQCIPAGVGRSAAVGSLEVSQFAPAQSFKFGGKKEKPYASRQGAFIASIDELVSTYGLPCPNYIKIDVPGLSGEILEGAEQTLARPEVREVHIELYETSSSGRRLVELLRRCGLELSARDDHGSTDLTFARAGA